MFMSIRHLLVRSFPSGGYANAHKLRAMPICVALVAWACGGPMCSNAQAQLRQTDTINGANSLTTARTTLDINIPQGAGGYTSAPTRPTHRVNGTVTLNYKDKQPDIISSLDRADFPFRVDMALVSAQAPVRLAKIVLEDPDGHYIKGKLNDAGQFTFEWIPVKTGTAHLTVWSIIETANKKVAVADWKGPEISSVDELTTNTGDYMVFSYSKSFSVNDAKISTGGLNLNVAIPQSHTSAPAFHFLDQGLLALNYFLDINGVTQMPKLNIVYTPTINNLTGGESGVYLPAKDPGMIYINPLMVWSGFCVRHEVAHVFQRHYMRNANYGRIGEPLANVHAAAMVGSSYLDRIYELEDMDVQANWYEDQFILLDGDGLYWQYTEGPFSGSPGWVQRVLWDLVDGNSEALTSYLSPEGQEIDAGDFDTIDGMGGSGQSTWGGDHLLNDVLVQYVGGGVNGLENGDYIDRGYDAVDVVDVLDGMVYLGYTDYAAIELLMNDAMEFGFETP